MDRLLKFQYFRLLFPQAWKGLALVCCLAFASQAGAQEFPYTAYVTGDQVFVRSGPGQRYYPTGQVASGYAVEVYRHDGNGWCAIRPVAGSFSWVGSHQVRTVEAGVVEVVGGHVVARVGSTLSPNRSAVQVLLPVGELLELMPPGDDDDRRWVRIAAPSGEFRWIAASALSRQPPVEPEPLPAVNGWSRQSNETRKDVEETPSVFDHLDQTVAVAQTGLAFGSPAVQVQTASNVNAPHAMDVVSGSPAELQLAQFQGQSLAQASPQAGLAPPSLLGSAGTTAPASPAMQAGASQPRVRFEGLTSPAPVTVGSVAELELRLSQTVVDVPKEWKLDGLETTANDMLAATKSLPERAQLREVLQRIARFQKVQKRYNDPTLDVHTLPAPAERDPFDTADADDADDGVTGLSASVRDRVRRDLDSNGGSAGANRPLYDAAGLLKPVVSKRPESPKYALVDQRGKVVSFVTPTPDLNLKPYIGRRIGVHGKRGFMPEFRRAHVLAGRVTSLERTRRR